LSVPLIVTEADLANLSLLEPLKRKLENARVVLSDAVPPEVVTMNSEVLLRDEATGELRLVKVVYPAEADPGAGRVSVVGSAGTALLGASAGKTIQCELGGAVRRLRVEQVIHQPELSLRTQLVVRS
jgi:regulator of nucleoside diphosphate kinase